MPTNAPAILIPLVAKPVVAKELCIKIVCLKGRMVNVALGSFKEEKRVVVHKLFTSVKSCEGHDIFPRLIVYNLT